MVAGSSRSNLGNHDGFEFSEASAIALTLLFVAYITLSAATAAATSRPFSSMMSSSSAGVRVSSSACLFGLTAFRS